MATSIFDDKMILPNDEMVDKILGDTSSLWKKLKSHLMENYQSISQNWKFYSKKAGWSLVYKQKSITLFYFVPCNEYFMIAFVLSEKDEKTALQSSLPENIKKIIASATSYIEGKSFFVDVKDEKNLEAVFTLLRIKGEFKA